MSETSWSTGVNVLPTTLESLDLHLSTHTTIPPELNNLVNLKSLKMSYSSFTSIITTEFKAMLANFPGLVVFNFERCSIADDFNAIMAALPATLISIDLDHNSITGSVDNTISRMTALTTLHVNNNDLGPDIAADAFNGNTNLDTVHFEWNKFTGTSEWITNLPAATMREIGIRGNKFGGQWPDFHKLTKLSIIDAPFGNNWEGSIPEAFWNDLTEMSSMTFDGLTKITNSTVGAGIGNWSKLSTFVCVACTGMKGTSLPAEMSKLENLRVFVSFSTGWSGALPALGKNVFIMSLGGNAFTGTVPASFVNTTAMETFDVSRSTLTGDFPDISNWSKVKQITITRNSFTGGQLVLDTIFNRTTITDFNANGNQFSGSIPAALAQMSKLAKLQMADNLLTGSLPDLPSGSVPKLATIDFDNNKLTGTVPDTWAVHPAIKSLYLGTNQMTGVLPSVWKRDFTNLELQQNKFSGAMPDFKFDGITKFDISANSLDCPLSPFVEWWYTTAELPLDNLCTFACPAGQQYHPTKQCEPCKAGEFKGFADRSLCATCPQGTFNRDPSSSGCTTCPDGALCPGGTEYSLRSGWWAPENALPGTFAPIECPLDDTCTGGSESGKCQPPNTGVLCAVCPNNHYFSGNVCTECPDDGVVDSSIVGMTFVFAVACIFLVSLRIKTTFQPNFTDTVAILKQMVNFFVMTALVGEFQVIWPEIIKDLFEGLSAAASPNVVNMIPLTCALQNREHHSYYLKLVFIVVVPLITFVAPAVIFGCAYVYYACVGAPPEPRSDRVDSDTNTLSRFKTKMTDFYIVSVACVTFLLYPSCLKGYLATFSCRDVDGTRWLEEAMELDCSTNTHLEWAWGLAFPSAIILGIVIPVFGWYLLRGEVNRGQIHNKHTILRYGFLFSDYREERYYWEFVILAEKICMIFVNVFFRPLSGGAAYQVTFGAVIIITGLYTQVVFQPFKSDIVNRLEVARHLLTMGVLWLAELYAAGNSPTDDADNADRAIASLIIIIHIVYPSVCIYFLYVSIQTARKNPYPGEHEPSQLGLHHYKVQHSQGEKTVRHSIDMSHHVASDSDVEGRRPHARDSAHRRRPRSDSETETATETDYTSSSGSDRDRRR
eukprot:GFYU01005957.1.p1 GENE.GFYU01005957.1~~GFYU01005957.1.p1  ORF type:complete len:1115 (+),score=383.10 GFYU01005957.1:2-3346(+)